MKLIKVRFLQTYTVKAVNGKTYEKDSVHDLPEATASHFIGRKRAVLFTENSEAEVRPTEKPKAQPDERELTSHINLVSAWNRARMQQGVPELKPAPMAQPVAEVKPEPKAPVVLEFGDNPLVSCVMPTKNRRAFIKAAIDCWQKQTYQNKELIILDDGEDSVRNIIPRKGRIRYYRVEQCSTGKKRNLCNEKGKGEILCNFDDDDWSAPNRIERQVKELRETGKPVTGFSNIQYWFPDKDEARLYVAQVKGYVVGGSLCCLKSWWEKHPYPDKVKSSDNAVIYANLKDIAVVNELGLYVARAHDSNIGGDKRGIGQLATKDSLPIGFWENEALRIGK